MTSAIALMPAGTIAALGLAPGAPGVSQASAVIDPAVVCRMPGEGFPDMTRLMSVGAFHRPPLFRVSNGPNHEVRAVRTRGMGRERTGAPTLHREACSATVRRLVFSSAGLLSARGTRRFECKAPEQVVIRTRARFARPTGWVRHFDTRAVVHAPGRMITGSLMVATFSGRPLAYGAVDDTRHRVVLSTARPVCTPA